ncbi:MAG: DUF1553 domain-containing protein [Planctomycetaceae bacterium]|nr:DUF1553 domain-containing protein [Planctomycetaceae bacterium]
MNRFLAISAALRSGRHLLCTRLNFRLLFLLLILTVGRLQALTAGDLLPPDSPISTVIDHYVDQKNQDNGIAAGDRADDDTILRRTMLDLAGRIPTTTERNWYLSLPEQDRQETLIQWLSSLPDFDFHLRNSLDELLLPDRPNDGEFRDYLLTAVREHEPWSQVFREVMLAEEVEGPRKGAAQFLKTRVRELDDLTNDTAVLFFGVNISCAKCHDHPLVEEWKQDHFYGMQAFFSRTFTSKKNVVMERPYGEVKFKTTGGDDRQASFMFLTGTTAEDRTPVLSDDERKQLEERIRKLEREDDAEVVPTEFSPRAELIEIALADAETRFFARNMVNRTWARLMGTGLVDPPDQMHSGNPPSHPDLLTWLARDFAEHNYDLRRLIGGIVRSNAYARSSEWSSGSEPPSAQSFAVAATRPLTPRQLAISLIIASRNESQWLSPESINADSAEWLKRRTDLENQANGWMREFEQPTAGFQIAVDEALFFSNNDRIQNDLLRDGGDRIVGSAKATADPAEAAQILWQAICCREPSAEEIQIAGEWLAGPEESSGKRVQSLVWALMAGPEFRFNH